MARKKRVKGQEYVILHRPGHPLSDKRGNIREHRLVWYEAHGSIPDGYVVHHKNHVKNDNRLENLQAVSQAEHRKLHPPDHLRPRRPKGSTEWKTVTCLGCGIEFKKMAAVMRRDAKVGRTRTFCKHKCFFPAYKKTEVQHG